MLCDAHTHWKDGMTDQGVIRVVSFLSPDLPKGYSGLFTAGVHPMFAGSSVIPDTFDGLFSAVNCCGIGECGLDRRAKLPMQDHALIRPLYSVAPSSKLLIHPSITSLEALLRISVIRDVPFI